MRCFRIRAMGLISVAAAFVWLAVAGAAPVSADPVEQLRQTLQTPEGDPALRDRQTKRWIAALRSIDDLRRALVLAAWRDDGVDREIAAVDRANRTAVAERFEQAVREVLWHGDGKSRLSTVSLIDDLGLSLRGTQAGSSFVSRFGPDLAYLVDHDPSPVREAAARTLGRIHPDPAVAVPALGRLLEAGTASQRVAALDGISEMMRTASQLAAPNRNPIGAQTSLPEVAQVGCALVPLARRGLTDAEPVVRRRSVAALAQAVQALTVHLPSPCPPGGIKETKQHQIEAAVKRAELLPLIEVLKEQGPMLVRAFQDPDLEVRYWSRRTLEDLARCQASAATGADASLRENPVQLVAHQTPMPGPGAAKWEGLPAVLSSLAEGVADPDVRVRLAAIDALEAFGPAAAPAASALVAALNDPDRFVRWSAARTLGKLSPAQAERAVPALTAMLGDGDPDVKQAAAAALERYGISTSKPNRP